MTLYYNKIDRDKIPEIIKANNKKCKITILNNYDACKALIRKITEEAIELEDVINYDSSLDELADIQEVIRALATKQSWTMEQVERRRMQKYEERGGFEKNILLIEVD